MTAEFRIPLDIPEVEVLSTEITKDGRLVIKVESTLETTQCGICGEEIACRYGHGQERELRHLPVLDMPTYIRFRPRRGQCHDCEHEPTTTQVVSWYEERSPHTRAYDQWLMKQLVNTTVEDVSMRENIGYDAVIGALDRQIETQVNWSEIEDLGTIGIDEIALKKGTEKLCCNRDCTSEKWKKPSAGSAPGSKKKTVRAFLEQIPTALRKTIDTFTTDMWDGYPQVANDFVQEHDDVEGEIVVDRFHVAQNYRDGFDSLRKKEFKRLK